MFDICTVGETVMSTLGFGAALLLALIVGYAMGWRSGRDEGYRIGFRVARTRYQARGRGDVESS
jgi:hypothetical protein